MGEFSKLMMRYDMGLSTLKTAFENAYKFYH